MFTIYSQRNTVHVNKISSRSFLDNNITELQARHNWCCSKHFSKRKDKLTRHVRFEISKKDNTMWEKITDLDTRAKKSNKEIKSSIKNHKIK